MNISLHHFQKLSLPLFVWAHLHLQTSLELANLQLAFQSKISMEVEYLLEKKEIGRQGSLWKMQILNCIKCNQSSLDKIPSNFSIIYYESKSPFDLAVSGFKEK